MIWIAPSEKDTDNAALEKRLWDTADQFGANARPTGQHLLDSTFHHLLAP